MLITEQKLNALRCPWPVLTPTYNRYSIEALIARDEGGLVPVEPQSVLSEP